MALQFAIASLILLAFFVASKGLAEFIFPDTESPIQLMLGMAMAIALCILFAFANVIAHLILT